MEDYINNYFYNYDFDIRKKNDARWIDQKCTYDVLNIISDCILEHTNYSEEIEFTIKDIWKSDYSSNNVKQIFSKPDPKKDSKNEYDKYFSQPIKLLAYSNILSSRKTNNRYYFKIKNLLILEFISQRYLNSLQFLIIYIKKVLLDSNLWDDFEIFFQNQTQKEYLSLKTKFSNFTIINTNINTQVECNRIFIKILNPIAYIKKKKGTISGRISKQIITLNDLHYNRVNWRDYRTGKDKNISRKEFEEYLKTPEVKYNIGKAKKLVKRYNHIYNHGKSEVVQDNENCTAIHIHHIFPQSLFPLVSDYLENLIPLTPNQHYVYAHPNGDTHDINKEYQYICLIAKTNVIYENIFKNNNLIYYDFEKFIFVLNYGLDTSDFDEINNLDFNSLLEKIDFYYSHFISEDNTELIISNKKNY